MGELLYTYDDPPSEKHIAWAKGILENNGIIGYPTDSNWAVGCDVTSPKAIQRLSALKPVHPKSRPFTLLCADISMAAHYASIDQQSFRFLQRIWPGPFTVILPRGKNLPKQIKDKRKVVGIRIPDTPLIAAIVRALGRPMISSSLPAIPSTGLPVRMGFEYDQHWGHCVDLILDLGTELTGEESTVIEIIDGVPQLLRLGAGDPSSIGIEP